MKITVKRGPIWAGLALMLLLGVISTTGWAQDTQAKYMRKSISYLDAVLNLGQVSLNTEQESMLLRALKTKIEMPRFDFNPLPEVILIEFKRDLERYPYPNVEAVIASLNMRVVPEVRRILDYEKEMRAQGLVSEAEQHSFIVEKAKERGITAEDLELILNSAYFYLPYITQYTISENEKNQRATCCLTGGILWFRLRTDSTEANVDFLADIHGLAVGSVKRNEFFGGRLGSSRLDAFNEAACTLAQDLMVKTQKLPDFLITHPLTAVGPGWVEFSLGGKEGVKTDDKYIISEYYETKDGSLKQRQLGMVRVSKVADNRQIQADSRARTVMGGHFQHGMLAQEHPRLPFDLSFRLATCPLSVSSGHVENAAFSGNQDLEFTQSEKAQIYVGQLWCHYNLAHLTRISQFFFSFYGELGGGKLAGGQVFNQELPVGSYLGGGAGLVKKYYLNRLHWSWELLFSAARYQLTGHTDDDQSWEWEIISPFLALHSNLEIALSSDWNLGFGGSYRLAAPSKDWDYKFDGEKQTLNATSDLPEANLSGWGFQVYLTWSVASLGWDPFSLFDLL